MTWKLVECILYYYWWIVSCELYDIICAGEGNKVIANVNVNLVYQGGWNKFLLLSCMHTSHYIYTVKCGLSCLAAQVSAVWQFPKSVRQSPLFVPARQLGQNNNVLHSVAKGRIARPSQTADAASVTIPSAVIVAWAAISLCRVLWKAWPHSCQKQQPYTTQWQEPIVHQRR